MEEIADKLADLLDAIDAFVDGFQDGSPSAATIEEFNTAREKARTHLEKIGFYHDWRN